MVLAFMRQKCFHKKLLLTVKMLGLTIIRLSA